MCGWVDEYFRGFRAEVVVASLLLCIGVGVDEYFTLLYGRSEAGVGVDRTMYCKVS